MARMCIFVISENIFRLGKACDDGTLIGCYFQGTMLYRQGTQNSQAQTTTSVLGKVFFIPLDAFWGG
jgi:hypothetical protein